MILVWLIALFAFGMYAIAYMGILVIIAILKCAFWIIGTVICNLRED